MMFEVNLKEKRRIKSRVEQDQRRKLGNIGENEMIL